MNMRAELTPDLTSAEIKASRQVINETTEMATETTMLAPRFYTTDFDEMDRIDVTPVREEWDALIAQMKSDPNRSTSRRPPSGTRSTGTAWSRSSSAS